MVLRPLSALLASSCAVLALGQPANSGPVQAGVLETMKKAEAAIVEGNYAKAEALSQLVELRTIKVEFDVSRAPFLLKGQCITAANTALRAWEDALLGSVQFEVVPANQAEVRIQFQPQVSVGGACAAGRAEITRNVHYWGMGCYRPHLSATLQVQTRPSITSMTHTVAHEVGHVLGLEDSGSEEGVMGSILRPDEERLPSFAEANTLVDLRIQAQQMLLRASDYQPR